MDKELLISAIGGLIISIFVMVAYSFSHFESVVVGFLVIIFLYNRIYLLRICNYYKTKQENKPWVA